MKRDRRRKRLSYLVFFVASVGEGDVETSVPGAGEDLDVCSIACVSSYPRHQSLEKLTSSSELYEKVKRSTRTLGSYSEGKAERSTPWRSTDRLPHTSPSPLVPYSRA